MQKALLIVLVSFLTIFCDGQTQEIPFHLTNEGHILIQIEIRDSIKANFIFDTGAGLNVVSEKTFQILKSKSTEEGFFTGYRHDGDRLSGVIYSTREISFAGINNKLIFGKYDALDAFGIDGLLSLKFFEDTPFTIDFVNKKIILLDAENVERLVLKNLTVPISLHTVGETSMDMYIPLCIGDITLDAQFDTGSGFGAYILNPYFIDKLDLDKDEVDLKKYVTPISNTSLVDSVFQVDELSICSPSAYISEENVKLFFREGMIHEALIGSHLFRNKKITIDLNRKLMVISE